MNNNLFKFLNCISLGNCVKKEFTQPRLAMTNQQFPLVIFPDLTNL